VYFVRKEDMEGTPVYKLKLTLKNGDIRNIYIDAENYLELKVTSKRKTPGGEIVVDQFMGVRQLCELCGPLRALRKRNPLEKQRYVGAKLAKDRKARKEAHQPRGLKGRS